MDAGAVENAGAKPGSESRAVRRPSRMDVQQAAPLRPGIVVAGRYRIERLIGVGGMGAVYEATQVAIQRRVALKVVRADFAGDAAMAARFQREARAASAVHHPNVVMVHDFGQDEDATLFMVMELLSGESLLQRMRRDGSLPPREAVRIAIEVLGALEAAHEAGVVHRDLKPDNVLLTEAFFPGAGKLKVLDFGIARIVDRSGQTGGAQQRQSDAGLTEVGQMLGTPRYMSPEAVARLPVGPAADLYALGAILFEMIAGRPVFAEREPVILMGHHLRTPAPRLRDSAPSGLYVPRALDDLVDALLAKLPTERPNSAAVVRKTLLDLIADPLAFDPPPEEVHAKIFTPPPDQVVKPEHFVRGRSPLWRALRLVPVVLLVAGIGTMLYFHRLRLEQRRAEEQSRIGVIAHTPTPAEEPVERRVEHVRITLTGAPESARFTWDGAPIEGPVFDVPFDGLSHRLEVSARGYRARQVDVIADGPHQLDVSLERARRGAPRAER
ncbi:serine/threonine-protein kinase [Sandaracinus amylolyticus]|nr:serine/threonine-protein kinase [Sandaracinus amylolyticus]